MFAVCQQYQSQGFSPTDWVSIGLAGAAFVVSVWSLYTTSLRRADIDVIHIESPYELQSSGSSGDSPTPARLHIALFVANTGSTGTVLTDLWLTYKEENVLPRVWSQWFGNLKLGGVEPPAAFERDDARSAAVERQLAWRTEHPGETMDAEELAWNMRGLRSLTVTVHWTFKRRKLFGREHESVTRQLPIVVDVEPFRAHLIEFWSAYTGREHLAEIVDPRTKPKDHPNAAGSL